MRVSETQVPGEGERFAVTFDDGARLVVFIHNEGGREVFWRPAGDADGERLFELAEHEARTLAEVFDGTYFEPVDEGVEDALEDAVVEWVEVGAETPLAGRSLREAAVRSRTGVTVLAVQRGERTVSTPDPDFELAAGDVAVVVGSRTAHERFEALLSGDLDDADA